MARKSRKNAASAAVSTPQMSVWRAALYIRLSVEFNSNKGDSLETQKDIMEAHLALHPDIEIAGIYTDNGVSGQTLQRPAFQRMLEDIESGKITCVVTKDLSRLGRSTIDTGYYMGKNPRLPSLETLAVLCRELHASADEVMGLRDASAETHDKMEETQ